MPDELPIRDAIETDIPVLSRYRRLMHEEIRIIRGVAIVPVEMAAMEEAYARFARTHLADGTMKAWVIEGQSQIAACGAILLMAYPPFPGDPSGRIARLYSVYTLPEFRHQGLARRITEQAIAYCKAQGFKRITLGASPMGRPLYEALGFQPTSEMRLNL